MQARNVIKWKLTERRELFSTVWFEINDSLRKRDEWSF